MSDFKIAAAQIASVRGDIDANIRTHLKVVEKAGALNVSYIFFPELSLTGYELDLAKSLALDPDDKRLHPIGAAAIKNNMHIVVGAPLKNGPLPALGAIIFCPDGSVGTYSKINVHESEEKYFCRGKDYSIVKAHDQKIANAICADLTVPEHVNTCIKSGATIYAAGAFISPAGYHRDEEMLQRYAAENDILVMLANYPQTPERMDSAGKSTAWFGSQKILSADESQPALLIAEKSDMGWKASISEI